MLKANLFILALLISSSTSLELKDLWQKIKDKNFECNKFDDKSLPDTEEILRFVSCDQEGARWSYKYKV